MKILFLSDIHGKYENLHVIERVLETQKIEKLVVLGDLYYQANNTRILSKIDRFQVRDFLEKYQNILICMRGNCDADVDVVTSSFPICEGLSMILVDDISIYITHGNEHSMKKNEKFLDREGVLVYGHEHVPYIKRMKDMVYINVGSISFPREGNLPTYMIYEDKTFTIYDIEGMIVDEITVDN